MQVSETFIPIVMFITVFGILYVFFNTRHKERLAMIEKGADASLFHSGKSNKFRSLKFGMFLVGIALGILLGNVLTVSTQLKEETAYFSMIFLCGGVSLILFHIIERRTKTE